MREILFRAKDIRTREWTYGQYCNGKETTFCFTEDYERHPVKTFHYILRDEMTDYGMPNQIRMYEVDGETVAQYTGFCDKDEKRIFEGDILESGGEKYVVEWNGEKASFYVRNAYGSLTPLDEVKKPLRIIGNICDSPDMFEVHKETTKHVYYLSGPVTGHPDYMEEFAAAKNILLGQGLSVVNPVEVNSTLPEDTSYENFMHVCFAMMDLCDSIVLLPGWESSSGAKREIEYAKKMHMELLHLEQFS